MITWLGEAEDCRVEVETCQVSHMLRQVTPKTYSGSQILCKTFQMPGWGRVQPEQTFQILSWVRLHIEKSFQILSKSKLPPEKTFQIPD